jgi:hypothetical protein
MTLMRSIVRRCGFATDCIGIVTVVAAQVTHRNKIGLPRRGGNREKMTDATAETIGAFADHVQERN